MSVRHLIPEELTKELEGVLSFGDMVHVVDKELEKFVKTLPESLQFGKSDLDAWKLMLYIYYNNKDKYQHESAKFKLATGLDFELLDAKAREKFVEDVCFKYFLDSQVMTFESCAYLVASMFGIRRGDLLSSCNVCDFYGDVDKIVGKGCKSFNNYRSYCDDRYLGLRELNTFFAHRRANLTNILNKLGMTEVLLIYVSFVVSNNKICFTKPDPMFTTQYFTDRYSFWEDVARNYFSSLWNIPIAEDTNKRILDSCRLLIHKNITTRVSRFGNPNMMSINDQRKVDKYIRNMIDVLGVEYTTDLQMYMFACYWYNVGFSEHVIKEVSI